LEKRRHGSRDRFGQGYQHDPQPVHRRHTEAALDWDKAIGLSPQAQQTGFRLRGALSRVRAGQVDAAVEVAEELAKNADAGTLYDAACVLALAAGRGDKAGGSLSKEECAQRAIVFHCHTGGNRSVSTGQKRHSNLRIRAD
jgi:hypothetical protein